MYTITEIEDALIQTIRESEIGAYCKKIDSYQIEGGDVEEQIRIFSGQLPCVLVVYSEGTFADQAFGVLDKEMTFSILACAQSLRGDGQARRGNIGTYKMLDDLRKTLTGNTLGLNIHPLLPSREAGEINTKMFSAYSIEFKTKCRFIL